MFFHHAKYTNLLELLLQVQIWILPAPCSEQLKSSKKCVDEASLWWWPIDQSHVRFQLNSERNVTVKSERHKFTDHWSSGFKKPPNHLTTFWSRLQGLPGNSRLVSQLYVRGKRFLVDLSGSADWDFSFSLVSLVSRRLEGWLFMTFWPNVRSYMRILGNKKPL